MKTIDVKSMIIGVLLTTTIIFGMGATGKADVDKWDNNQMWEITTGKPFNQQWSLKRGYPKDGEFHLFGKKWDAAAFGAEPFAVQGDMILFRKRIQGVDEDF